LQKNKNAGRLYRITKQRKKNRISEAKPTAVIAKSYWIECVRMTMQLLRAEDILQAHAAGTQQPPSCRWKAEEDRIVGNVGFVYRAIHSVASWKYATVTHVLLAE